MSGNRVGCDSSVLIPALYRQHSSHELCLPVLREITHLPAHVLLETYSWLTGSRDGRGVSPVPVVEVLQRLEVPTLQLPAEEYLRVLQTLADHGRSGGSVYDAQIAATAKYHGLTLISRDARATAIYELVGVSYELI